VIETGVAQWMKKVAFPQPFDPAEKVIGRELSSRDIPEKSWKGPVTRSSVEPTHAEAILRSRLPDRSTTITNELQPNQLRNSTERLMRSATESGSDNAKNSILNPIESVQNCQ
jgi:hypothetical protein